MTELKDIIAITGKPGLYRIINRSSKSIIVESMDAKRAKMPIHNNYQVALLEEITVYAQGETEITLKKVFEAIEAKDGAKVSISAKAEPAKLREYFREVAPEHDEEKVYVSDIKKILKWYDLISEFGQN